MLVIALSMTLLKMRGGEDVRNVWGSQIIQYQIMYAQKIT